MKNTKLFIILFFVITGIFSCQKDTPEVQPPARGTLISASLLGEFSTTELNVGLLSYQIALTQPLKYSVKIYKIRYHTIDFSGQPTIATGALVVPQTSESAPLLSFQHGTQTKRTEVASLKGIFTLEGFGACIAASLGYVSCVPDYLGMGESTLVHPYLIADVSASAVIDLMIATKHYCTENSISLNEQVFIAGYSEGGYATLAAQNELETNYTDLFMLTASAPMAGPYDMEYTVNSTFAAKSYSVPGYVGFLLYAYNTYYQIADLNEIFMPTYAAKIPTLFDGSKTIDQINPELTTNLTELLTPGFSENYIANTNSTFWAAVTENSLLAWKPKTKTYLIHSNGDDVVSYQNSVNALADFQNQGATNVELITIEGLSHTEAAIPAILLMIDKFEALRTGK